MTTFNSGAGGAHLPALRQELDDKLMELEAALAGDRPGASLEALLLDLARVATDEASAAAETACADARAEAEAAAQRLAALEHAHEAERRRLEDQQVAALAAERTKVGELERALQEARQTLESQRAAAAQSDAARLRAEERALAADKARADSAAQCEQLSRELDRLREALAAQEQANGELRQRVDAWQAEKDAWQAEKKEMQDVLAQVKSVFMRFGQQKIAIDERFRGLEAELERARAPLGGKSARPRA